MAFEIEIAALKKQFEESRASLMTQLFIMLATANGGGLATMLASISQVKTQTILVLYLVTSASLFGLGSFAVLLSGFIRFEHSKIAEKEKIAKIKKKLKSKGRISRIRKPIEKKYKTFMKLSVGSIFLAVSVLLFGAVHTYSNSKDNLSKQSPNKAFNADSQKRHGVCKMTANAAPLLPAG